MHRCKWLEGARGRPRQHLLKLVAPATNTHGPYSLEKGSVSVWFATAIFVQQCTNVYQRQLDQEFASLHKPLVLRRVAIDSFPLTTVLDSVPQVFHASPLRESLASACRIANKSDEMGLS